MRYCNRCVYPENHPLNLIIDDEGVCSGCRVHEEKDRLNWAERLEMLRHIVDDYRDETGRSYDCIVPVDGARDSYFTVHIVKNVLRLNPLLVGYNKHFNTMLGIRNLAYLKIAFGCDYIEQVLKPETVKVITRASLAEMGSIYWHVLAGRTCFPVRTAVDYKIPLIIWGVHQGCDQVGMFSHLDEVEMTRKYRKEHDLLGVEIEDLAMRQPSVDLVEAEPFVYPSDRELASAGVRGIYLSNYIRWDSKAQHELMIKKFGYETGFSERTFDNYNHIDCHIYTDVHDYIKYLKWGYSKIHDHCSREIRLHRLTRATALGIVDAYRKKLPTGTKRFCEWLGVAEQELWERVDIHRDPRIWHRDERGWSLGDDVVNHPHAQPWAGSRDDCTFLRTPSRTPGVADDRYVLIGRGFVPGMGPEQPVSGDWLL
ncbi:MAG: N-acetyl sugar amidotransferase [Magnetospirillum sp.]|nr:N-acetyl sugar amidotransferase [Magnetospirillum sp.]